MTEGLSVVFIGGIAVALAILYFVWKIRYRYPPSDIPQVLCYHKLSERFCLEGTWTTPRRFAGHVAHLAAAGFRIVGEDDFLRALDHRPGGAGRDLLLTFDDGYESLYDVFMERLAPRSIPVLVFVIAGFVGRENRWDVSLGRRRFRHLSWRQLGEMIRAGARVGSHGMTHVDLRRLGDADLDREIRGSKTEIENRTGSAVRTFSYAFGRYDARCRDVVRDAGYEAAFSLYPGRCNETVDRYALRRNGVYVIDSARALPRKLLPNPLYWFEEMKGRSINAVAALTPVLKRFSASPGK